MRNIVLGVLLSIFLFSCKSPQSAEESKVNLMKLNMPEQELAADEASEEPQTPDPVDRKLIKNGNIRFESEDVAATTNFVKRFVNENKGYISNESETREEDNFNKHLEVRLPNTAFNTFISKLNDHAVSFDSKEISVKDVTEDYVDIAARLKTKKEVEQKFIQILSKAKTVQEILNIEKEIGEIRSEIESVEGRLKLMENQVSFSTLQLNFYKKNQSKFSFLRSLGKAVGGGWDLLSSFIISIVHLWPFILITFGIVYFIKRRWRK